MRKLMLGLSPLLLTAAFMAGPSMASAATRAYGTCAGTGGGAPCPGVEKFTAFATGTAVAVTSKSTGKFVLENAEKNGIECKKLTDKGTDKNVEKENTKTKMKEVVGTSEDELTFEECVPVKELGAGCKEINPKTGHAITGKVTDEVAEGGTEVEIKIVAGTQFDVKCVIAEEEVDLKGVKGTAKGVISGNKLTFASAGGLTFFGSASTITGVNETTVASTGKPVFVN